MLSFRAVPFNCKGLVPTESKSDTQNSSQNCPRGQFAWVRLGRKKFLCLQAPSVQELLSWDLTAKASSVSLRAWKQFLMGPFMCLLWSSKERRKEMNQQSIWHWIPMEQVHVHPPIIIFSPVKVSRESDRQCQDSTLPRVFCRVLNDCCWKRPDLLLNIKRLQNPSLRIWKCLL